jgi:hypothetical protein
LPGVTACTIAGTAAPAISIIRFRSCEWPASAQAPSLVNGTWFFGDGSLKAITQTIDDGVPRPRNYSDPMPPKGGAPLSNTDVTAVAAYVWAISHPAGK